MPNIVFEAFPKGEVAVGRGCVVVVSGYNQDINNPLSSLQLCIDDSWQTVKYLNERRDDLSKSLAGDDGATLRVGFWGTYQIDTSISTGPATITYNAVFLDKTKETGKVTDITLELSLHSPSDDSVSLTRGAPVTICMAVYEPNEEFLGAQLRSIQGQSYQDWECLICDDNSSKAAVAMIARLCQGEPRFHLIKNSNNVGFYSNFERCLKTVPRDSQFIALCDQDDVWYADKLETLLRVFDSDTTLVYSDMRLVDAKNEVLSETYWSGRKNNYSKLNTLMVANTITGAASLFRASLLDLILPFPERIGDSYHDHWVALVAFLGGDIRYVDEPLYDYRQHENNIIGQSVFDDDEDSVSIWQSIQTESKTAFSPPAIQNEEAPSAPQPSESSVAPASLFEKPTKSSALAESQGVGLTSFPRFECNGVKFEIPPGDSMTDHRSAVHRATRFLVIVSQFLILVIINLARSCVRYVMIWAHHIILVARSCVRYVIIRAHHRAHHIILMTQHWIRFLSQIFLHRLMTQQSVLGSLAAIISVAERGGLLFLVRPLGRRLITREHHKSQYEFFRHQCRSLELFSQTLRLRFNDRNFDDDTQRALNIFGHGRTSARYLQQISRQVEKDGETTGGREIAMANGYLAATLERSVAGNKSIVSGIASE